MNSQRRSTVIKLQRAKNAGLFGGICLLVNSIAGPGIPFIAAIFQESGWITAVFLFGIFYFLFTQSALLTLVAIRAIPGNRNFQGSIEYTTIVNFYLGRSWHWIGQITLLLSTISGAVQSIVISSQVCDFLVLELLGKTCGVVADKKLKLLCIEKSSHFKSNPFVESYLILSTGLVLVTLLSVSIGLFSFKENVLLQKAYFFILVITVFLWVMASLKDCNESSIMPSFGTKYYYVFGTVMLNMAGATAIPSWINIKRNTVNAAVNIYTSGAILVTMYLLVGLVPGSCVGLDSSENLLSSLLKRGLIGRYSTYIFVFMVLVPSIGPNFTSSVNNMIQNNICGKGVACIIGFLVPWLFTIPLQSGEYMKTFVSWTSMLFTSFVNFTLVAKMYLECRNFRIRYVTNRILSGKQKKLLKSIHYLSDTIKRFIDECPEYSEKSESNFNVSLHYGSMNREGLITPKLSRYRLSDTSGCTPKLDIISTDGAASHPMNCSEPQQKTFVPGMFVRYDEPLVRTKLSTRDPSRYRLRSRSYDASCARLNTGVTGFAISSRLLTSSHYETPFTLTNTFTQSGKLGQTYCPRSLSLSALDYKKDNFPDKEHSRNFELKKSLYGVSDNFTDYPINISSDKYSTKYPNAKILRRIKTASIPINLDKSAAVLPYTHAHPKDATIIPFERSSHPTVLSSHWDTDGLDDETAYPYANECLEAESNLIGDTIPSAKSAKTAVAQDILRPCDFPMVTDLDEDKKFASIKDYPTIFTLSSYNRKTWGGSNFPVALADKPAFKFLSPTNAPPPSPRGSRRSTLPSDPSYLTPEFRVIPNWINIREESLAKFILVLTTAVTILAVILEILSYY